MRISASKRSKASQPVAMSIVALLILVVLAAVVSTEESSWDSTTEPFLAAHQPLSVNNTDPSFDSLAKGVYTIATAPRPRENPSQPPTFDVSEWKEKTIGGLHDSDRILLAKVYGQSSSVFEWGLGESTRIARAMHVPRYAGIDSDASYVELARGTGAPWFRFYFADVGPTEKWGLPQDRTLPKIIYNYVLSPLMAESQAFDVYYVDGQMRVLCALAAFLHASKYGKTETLVMVHDYYEKKYSQRCEDCSNTVWQKDFHRLEDVADMVDHSKGEIACFRRKAHVTDEQLMNMFDEFQRKRLDDASKAAKTDS